MKRIIGIAITALITFSALAGCGNSSVTKDSTDVVIIGAGGAGLAAAVQAHDDGAKVVVLEKMPMVGGNTTRATGGLNAAGTKYQQEKGFEDSTELFFQDTMKGGKEINNPELVKVLVDNSAAAVEWLEGLGADLSDVGRMGGASVNRTHRPTGGAAVGSHIVTTLKKAVEERGIDVRLMNKAIEIEADSEGNITGVKATDKEGKEYTIDAKAVVVASGGYAGSPEKFVEYNKALEGFGTTNHPGATGDGIDLLGSLGAQFVDMEQIQTHPTVVPKKGIMITEAVRGNGAILVNNSGKRFINELDTRDVVSKAILSQDSKTAFLIFDDGVRKSLSATEKYFKMELVTEGETLEDLASKLKVSPETLKETIDNYNTVVSDNKDEEFNRTNFARAINEGKYYAIEVAPAVHHTMGGVVINTDSQVIGEGDKPISGVYAAGEVTGGVHGANRLGGNALADIIVFGRIAGANAAKTIK